MCAPTLSSLLTLTVTPYISVCVCVGGGVGVIYVVSGRETDMQGKIGLRGIMFYYFTSTSAISNNIKFYGQKLIAG